MGTANIEHIFIITGATRGIGKALVSQALELPNSYVVSLSRTRAFRKNNYQSVRIDLNDTGRIAQVFKDIHFDVRRHAQLKNAVLINNAGVLDPIAAIGDCDDDSIHQNIRVNLIAPMILSRHFFHFSKPFPGDKWILNITSGASQSPYYGWSAYCSAKAGLDMATSAMALEFAITDPAFRACAIAPGTVDTDMQAKIRECTKEQFPKVGKFIDLKSKGELFSPEWTASSLIRSLLEGLFENGGRYDLREIADDL